MNVMFVIVCVSVCSQEGPYVTTADLFILVHLGKRAVSLRLKGFLVIHRLN